MPADFNLLERIDPSPLLGSPRQLLNSEIDGLWALFVEINSRWRLFHTRDAEIEVPDAKNLHSSWLELVTLRAQPHQYPNCLQQLPCYVEEYVNALSVIAALCSHDDSEYALDPLLAVTTQPENSRIWHARKFVVEEFMTVMIVAGGFKEFGGHNYDGFLGGSRFNEVTQIVAPLPSERGSAGTTW